MTDGAPSFDRRLIIDELQELQSRVCRLASELDWPGVEGCLVPDGQFRAYDAEGTLACFAAAPEIGRTLDATFGPPMRTTVRAFDPDIEVLSPVRASGTWTVEQVVIVDSARPPSKTFGRLDTEFLRTDSGWRICSLDFSAGAGPGDGPPSDDGSHGVSDGLP